MDPLTILSVAAAVVQFTDFGTRLVSRSVTLYRRLSGPDRDIVELSDISDDLFHLSEALTKKTRLLSTLNRPIGNSEIAVLRECTRCESISRDLQDLISRIQRNGVSTVQFSAQQTSIKTKLQNFRSIALAVWNDDKIEGLKNRLMESKHDLMLAMITRLWEQSLTSTSGTKSGLDEQLDASRGGSANADVLRAAFTCEPASERQRLSSTQHDDVSDAECLSAILESLDDPALRTREVNIADAHRQTFEWIFETGSSSPDSDQQSLSDFPGWLRGRSEEVYWITGKPGSGKSTLMKFISRHPKTLSHLSCWAGGLPVLCAAFYSWDAGTELQKSQEGLLRTLLHQLVAKDPDLAPEIFPRRWAMHQLFGTSSTHKLPPWKPEELLGAIKSLRRLSGTKFCLAVFIDGLDEFSEMDNGHAHLIRLVQELQSLPSTKVCVSSRPWVLFRDTFSTFPQLRMEKITHGDISAFVNSKFSGSIAFCELRQHLPVEADHLLSGIVDKAQGVFLWVAVVTDLLLNALAEGGTLPELQNLLEDVPSDLMRLYSRLWERIKPEHRSVGARLIILYRTYIKSPRIGDLRIVIDHGMDAATLWKVDQGLIEGNEQQMISSMKRRLNSRTRGLLVVTESSKIEYLHRTAKDWMESRLTEITSSLLDNFDPHLELLQYRVQCMCARIKASRAIFRGHWKSEETSNNVRWEDLLSVLYHLSNIEENAQNYSRVLECVEHLKDQFRVKTVTSYQTQQVAPDALPSGDIVRFNALAAHFGATTYIQSVLSDPSRLDELLPDILVGRDEYDLLTGLVFGAGIQNQLSVYTRSPFETQQESTREPNFTPLRETIFNFIREGILPGNQAARYKLLVELLPSAISRSKKCPAARKRHSKILANLTRYANDTQTPLMLLAPHWKEIEINDPSNPGTTIRLPYILAVIKLFELHGIRCYSWTDRLKRSFKQMLE